MRMPAVMPGLKISWRSLMNLPRLCQSGSGDWKRSYGKLKVIKIRKRRTKVKRMMIIRKVEGTIMLKSERKFCFLQVHGVF